MPTPSPLSCVWVERSLCIVVEGQAVTGTARANWGAVEVTITSPIAHVTRRWDGRGWAFAMLAHHRPEERYACDGAFTARGLQSAERFLTDLYLDWLALSRIDGEVDEACRRARQELVTIEKGLAEQLRPLQERRSALRRAFRAGELTQQEHQRRRKAVKEEMDRCNSQRWEAEQAARRRFTAWLEGRCGRRLSLDDAEKLLLEAAVVRWADDQP